MFPLIMFFSLLKSRVNVEFAYFKLIGDLQKFQSMWALEGVRCSIGDDNNFVFKFLLITGLHKVFCICFLGYHFGFIF